MANHYQVLGVSPSCSHEELKKCYHSLVREHHPDKRVGEEEHSSHFLLIDQAWKVLSKPDQRRKYDAELRASESRSNRPVQEELHLRDMDLDGKLNQYVKDCRCSGQYILCETETCEGGLLLVDCDNCSLSIVVDCDNVDDNKVGHS